MQQMAAAAQMAQTAQQGAGAVRQTAQAAEGDELEEIAELLGAGGKKVFDKVIKIAHVYLRFMTLGSF